MKLPTLVKKHILKLKGVEWDVHIRNTVAKRVNNHPMIIPMTNCSFSNTTFITSF